jgi:putative flippase GtrA
MSAPSVTRPRALRLPASLAGLIQRSRRPFAEVGKFGIVGACCYGIAVATYAFGLWLGMDSYVALFFSTAISTTCAFIGNRFWTWRHASPTSLRRAYGLYFGFNLVGLAIGSACLFASHSMLGSAWPAFQTPLADLIASQVVGVILASLFRFWAYRRFVFGSPIRGF